jgi:nitroreductase
MEPITREQIIGALNWRYAVKAFDPSKKVSEENLHTILESGRLAPSTVGLEPWKFILVKNPEIRAKLSAAGYGQPKITQASHLIVIAHRTDAKALPVELIERTGKAQGKTTEELSGLKRMAEGSVTSHPNPISCEGWLAAQTYIPLGMMIETAALLGVDAGPMEGFDPKQVDEILGLKEKNLASSTMLALGYRGEDPFAALPKTRRAFEDVVMEV